MQHDTVLICCTDIQATLLSNIVDSHALHKRLKAMGHAQFVAWIREHVDEIELLISSLYPNNQSLPAVPRRDLLLYAAVFVCGLAEGLLELCQQLAWPVTGQPAEVVANMGLQALALCGRKTAHWPWDSKHPFA